MQNGQTTAPANSSEANYSRLITTSLPLTIYVIGTDYRIRFMNSHARKMAGLNGAYAENAFCHQITHHRSEPCNSPDEPCPVREAVRTKAPASMFHRHADREGVQRVFEVSAFPIFDERREVSEIIEVVREAPDAALAERLQESQTDLLKKHEDLNRLFKNVEKAKMEWERSMDCVDDMVILLDRDYKIQRCNRMFKEFLGRSYQEIIGGNWEEFLLSRSMEIRNHPGREIGLFHRPSGRWFTLKMYPFAAEADKDSSGTVISLHDVTELKLANVKLEHAYDELKATQAKILQQEKMASIGQLAAGVAHEINNPMGFIASNLGTLGKYVDRITEFVSAQARALASSSPADAAKDVDEARKRLKLDYVVADVKKLITESLDGADRVKVIVQNLKNFSRVDQAEQKSANINDCIETTLNIVWNELKYKTTVTKEYGDVPVTRCFPQQLNQVFMNLLVNAAHAIEKQGEITIRTWSDDGSIFASVSDTGCGIPKENLSRIFEPFFTTKEVGKGTGLGLSIAYDIMKKHNGDISVQSESGRGTTFTIRIPVVEEGRS